MNRMLLSLLLAAATPAAQADTVQSTTPFPGHAAGSFGQGDMPFGQLSGGAVWSADGRTVFTLDTTRVLKRWSVDGRLHATQVLTAPATMQGAGLTLAGTATSSGLSLVARGHRAGQPVTLAYRLNPGTGTVTPQTGCPGSLLTGLTCTLDARVWVEGGELQWQRDGTVEPFALPAGLRLAPDGGRATFALTVSGDGQRVALLALRSEPEDRDVTIFGGRGVLLTWVRDGSGQVTAQQTTVPGAALYAGASLAWVPGGVLVASNVFNAGNEYGSGGALHGQHLGLYPPGGKAAWSLGPQVGLRGAFASPDGALFVTVRDGSVPEVRRASDGSFVRSLGEAVLDSEPLSGGRALLAVQGGGGTGRVVLHAPGRLQTLFQGRASLVAVSRDGRRLASVAGRTVRLHDATGRVLRTWDTPGRVLGVAFSPDGQVLSAELLGMNGPNVVRAWRLDGSAFLLPAGAQFPVSSVLLVKESRKDGPQNAYRERWVVTDRSGGALWRTPWHSSGIFGQPSTDGRFLAQSGMTAQTMNPGELGPVPRVNVFSRVDARTGQSGPVLRVPVEHPGDVYAGWGVTAFDGRTVLLAETSGDGCGGTLYSYRLGDLSTGQVRSAPAQLHSGYRRLMGCGHHAFRPKTAFAPDGQLLIQDGNRLDWFTLGR